MIEDIEGGVSPIKKRKYRKAANLKKSGGRKVTGGRGGFSKTSRAGYGVNTRFRMGPGWSKPASGGTFGGTTPKPNKPYVIDDKGNVKLDPKSDPNVVNNYYTTNNTNTDNRDYSKHSEIINNINNPTGDKEIVEVEELSPAAKSFREACYNADNTRKPEGTLYNNGKNVCKWSTDPNYTDPTVTKIEYKGGSGGGNINVTNTVDQSG